MSRRGRDHRDSPARSESDQDSASDSDVFETPATGRSSESEPDWEDNENLATYYGKLDRVDDKEVTLSLHKRTIKLFFEKILGEQYKKLSAPDLLSASGLPAYAEGL